MARARLFFRRYGFAADHPWRGVRAVPQTAGVPQTWVLGSSGASAGEAAALGCAYAFAECVAGVDGAEHVAEYRRAFRPSPRLAAPRCCVAVAVVCAETQARAERLALSAQAWRPRLLAQGIERGFPSPENAAAFLAASGTPLETLHDDRRLIAGDPARVRRHLLETAERYAADELMILTITHAFADRLRSYQLIADTLGLAPRRVSRGSVRAAAGTRS